MLAESEGLPRRTVKTYRKGHLILVADDEIRQGLHTKASPLMWRSARCKRVNSTLAGETIAMSAALADVVWAQIMIQDALNQAVTTRDVTRDILPFEVVFSDCTLSNRLPHDQSIDAKSVFRCFDQGMCWKSTGSPHSGGLRGSHGNAQGSGLSHSMDPTRNVVIQLLWSLSRLSG